MDDTLSAPQQLRCEYQSDPLGIEATRPRLSWRVADPRAAELQTAYHLLVASDPGRLDADDGDLWDSGRVAGPQCLNVEYLGRPLASGQCAYWKVRTYDSDGLASPWSSAARFEMGLLQAADWQAQWLTCPSQGSATSAGPVPMLRHQFDLPGPVVAARLYVSAQGLYHAELNGRPITNAVLAPAWTDYRRRPTYQVYDVSELLAAGANALAVLLADGCYAGEPGLGSREQYGPAPALAAQLVVTLETGDQQIIATNDQWCWQPSWLLRSEWLRGEVADGRRRDPRWSRTCIGAGQPVTAKPLMPVPTAALGPALRRVDLVDPVAQPQVTVHALEPTRYLFDFGRLLFGRVRVALQAPAGQALVVRYGLAAADGALTQILAHDEYTTAGAAREEYEPCFAAYGFRYVELVTDLPQAAIERLLGVAIGPGLPVAGRFSCDHPAFNALFDDALATQQQLLQHVPMAGLGASERVARTGQARIHLNNNMRLLEAAPSYRKWLQDLADAQLPDGGLPAVVPAPPHAEVSFHDAGAQWGAAFVDTAWSLYRHYGDRRALERYYLPLRDYVLGLQRRHGDLVCRAPAHPFVEPGADPPGDLAATAHFYRNAKLLTRMAGVLGRISDLEAFEELAQGIRSAFRRRYVTMDGYLVGDSVGAYVLALHQGLLDGPERQLAFERLVDCLRRTAATPQLDAALVVPLLDVLANHGRLDLAYAWLLEVPQHLKAPACEWLVTGLAGFDLDSDLADTHNAYRQVVIQPRPPLGRGFAPRDADVVYQPPLRWVSVNLDTVNGYYETSWELTDDGFDVRLLVPPGCSARVIMPDGSEREVGSGAHELSLAFAEPGDGIPVLREVTEALQ